MPLWHDRKSGYTDAKRDGAGDEPSRHRKETRAERRETRVIETKRARGEDEAA